MSFEERRFCVYIHRRKDNGEVFYVGQGSELRPFSKSQRNPKWHSAVQNAGGFTVEVVQGSLTKTEAIALEKEIINIYSSSCVNRLHANSAIKEMPFDVFNATFYVDNSSPTGLRYKIDIYAGVDSRSKMKCAGDIAGNISDRKMYSIVSFNRKNYMVHRIVYLLHFGSIGALEVIDHINGNSRDNRIENLRLVSQLENTRNKAVMKNNTTGYSGVSYRLRSNSYEASLKLKDARVTKNFSCAKYGVDKALELAVAWRKDQELLHGFGINQGE